MPDVILVLLESENGFTGGQAWSIDKVCSAVSKSKASQQTSKKPGKTSECLMDTRIEVLIHNRIQNSTWSEESGKARNRSPGSFRDHRENERDSDSYSQSLTGSGAISMMKRFRLFKPYGG